LTGNSADLRTVLYSRLSHTELRSSLRQTHSFLSLPADTTWHHPFLEVHSAHEHRRYIPFQIPPSYSTFYAFFSDNIMTEVASKQQRTALFLSTIVTRTRRHTELTKTVKPEGKPVLCQRTFNSVFRAVFFLSYKAQFNLVWGLLHPALRRPSSFMSSLLLLLLNTRWQFHVFTGAAYLTSSLTKHNLTLYLFTS
jgi:hypothetical protein